MTKQRRIRERGGLSFRTFAIVLIISLLLLLLYFVGVFKLSPTAADNFFKESFKGKVYLADDNYPKAIIHLSNAFSMGLVAFPSESKLAASYFGAYATNTEIANAQSNVIYDYVMRYNRSVLPYVPLLETGINLGRAYLAVSNYTKARDVVTILSSYELAYPKLLFFDAKLAYLFGEDQRAKRLADEAEALCRKDIKLIDDDVMRLRRYLAKHSVYKKQF